MSARALCNFMYDALVTVHGTDVVEGMLNPPTRAELRAERIAELRASGIRFEVVA